MTTKGLENFNFTDMEGGKVVKMTNGKDHINDSIMENFIKSYSNPIEAGNLIKILDDKDKYVEFLENKISFITGKISTSISNKSFIDQDLVETYNSYLMVLNSIK